MQQKNRQRRLVNIPPVRMVRAGKIVQLVTENAVPVDRDQMKQEFCGWNDEKEDPGV